jgi:PIN domain nuclease of toxin-antitoxin system
LSLLPRFESVCFGGTANYHRRIGPAQCQREDAVQKNPRGTGILFDRTLIAQAIAHSLTIVTPDPLIAQYPIRVLW